MKIISKYLIILIILLITTIIYAGGISVSPAKYYWKNVPIGIKTECPVPITIKNTKEVVTSYSIRSVKPKTIGVNTDEGFKEIPSKKWISFERKHIASNPNEEVKLKMFISIPDKKEYLNQNWEVIVGIKEHATKGNMFSLGCYLKIFITTTNKYNEN
ncbi:hypothetical protein GMMP15_1050015 [Candidatus Magnetomoraceae bacterium gMMP-15]